MIINPPTFPRGVGPRRKVGDKHPYKLEFVRALPGRRHNMDYQKPMSKTEEEWKERLTPEQYRILREKGTETPFSDKLLHEEREGVYLCAACGNPLFSSDAKFESGTGWPSFDEALPGSVRYERDESGGMSRIEILCSRCGSHLGHMFDDGPTETGKRYCMNSVCLELEAKDKKGV